MALAPDGFKASGFIDGPAFVEGFTFMQKLYTDAKISPPGQFDTALTPDAGKTSASRQTYVSGKAVERAVWKTTEPSIFCMIW